MQAPESQSMWYFFRKAAGLSLAFYLLLLLASVLFSLAVDWRQYQDPRERLLWDSLGQSNDVYTLGDSAFISAYVDREDDTLWRQLETLTGLTVFNGALNGSRPPDLLNAARVLARSGDSNAVVLMNILPTRFVQSRAPEPQAGNYAAHFSYRIAGNPIREAALLLRKPLLILNSDVLVHCLLRKQHFRVEPRRNRVWWKDGDFALNRFRTFQKYYQGDNPLLPFTWLKEADDLIRKNGNRMVIVITPLNTFLIDRYAAPAEADQIKRRFAEAHTALVQYLANSGIPFIDAYDQLDSESYADLLHFNTRGDRRLAELIADYLGARKAGNG